MVSIEQFVRTEENARNRPVVDKAPDNWKDTYFNDLITIMSVRYVDGLVDISQMASNDECRYKLTLEQFDEVASTVEAAGYTIKRNFGIEHTIPYLTINWRGRMPR
jgi:hypothetical protein